LTLSSGLACRPERLSPMTPDSADLVDEFVDYAIEQSHPLVRECAGEDLRSNLADVVRLHAQWMTSTEFARSHSRGYEAFGAPLEAFNNRLVQLGSLRLIAGIRFRNLDIRHPFVTIDQSSLPIGGLADGTLLKDAIRAEFSIFRPLALSFHHPSHLPLRLQGTVADFHVLIAPAQAMAAAPAPLGLDRVSLVLCAGLDVYERYVALYHDIYNERAWARAELRIEDRESLADCRAQGLMFDVHVDGVWSGIMAGTRFGREAHGAVKGIQVAEMVLAKSARGSGLGVAIQRRFAEHVAAREPNTTIWGTIAHANLPMRRTAERAGRIDVGTTYCIDL
jgi:L-amino acid N-acyltransferase YncA